MVAQCDAEQQAIGPHEYSNRLSRVGGVQAVNPVGLVCGRVEDRIESEVWVLRSRGIDCIENRRAAWQLQVLAAALLAAFGCSDSNQAPSPSDAAPPSSHSSTGPDCVGAGQSCADADCCEGRCQDSICMALDAPHCAALGQDCSRTDCCEGSCQQGTCMSAASGHCAQIGQDCSTDDCCSGVCEASVCVERATCVPSGGDCSNRDCCEGSCEGSICG